MKEWFTAAELAALRLPALPETKRSINRIAARESWPAREREGRGGGVEYSLDALPAEARRAYVAGHVPAIELPSSIARAAASEPAAIHIHGPATDARDARLALLAVAEKFGASSGLLRKRADRHFCDLYNATAASRTALDDAAAGLQVAGWIRAEVKSLTPRTLARWRRLRHSGNLSGLAVDRAKARKGTGILDTANNGEVKTFMLALLAKQPQLTAHHIRQIVADHFNGELRVGFNGHARIVPVPPVRTFQYALKALRRDYRNELMRVRDPDGFKSRVKFAARVSVPASRLNEVWQIDASPADVLVREGSGTARYALYACVDIYSRRIVGLVTKTPRAAAVGLLIRKAIIAWGVPERIKTDQGSDFTARDTQRLLDTLGIEHEPVTPFSPEKKGHVERAIGTMQRGLMRTLPGFIGHSVADRKVIEGRKAFSARLGEDAEDMFQVELDAGALQKHIDDWCETIYGRAPHAGLKGATPFAVAAGYPVPPRRIGDIRALDMLLAPVAGKNGLRTVTKSGIRINGTHYMGGFLEVGATVLVRMDPADMGRAFVFEEDGTRFLGEAIAPEVLGIDPAAAIAAVKAEQKRILDESFKDAKAVARRVKAKDMAPAIHRQALKDAGKLVEFPKGSTAHETPALAAAAAARGDNAEPVFSDDVLAMHARLVEEAAQPESKIVRPARMRETEHHRWNRACALMSAVARGETISADDAQWLDGYQSGPEYRGFRQTYGDAAVTDQQQRSKL